MKIAFKILLLFAVITAFIPIGEFYEFTAVNTIEHNCCGDETEQTGNACNPICCCFSTMTLTDIIYSSFSLEVKFFHSNSFTNKFTEEQTEPEFRPPIA